MVRGSVGSWVTGSVTLLRQEAGHLGVVQKAQGVGRLGAREQQVQHVLPHFLPSPGHLVCFFLCLSFSEGGWDGRRRGGAVKRAD